ncbi:Hypothetical protein SRAE_X000158900 [Strongyloides ratti]|uniref:Uncharacterized protein n=1 Tax=Strongyloides ratti TaxID=34506 RepID=A0A090KVF2_STRRB|nr:Hypothetical protein SRAE_X000158900 [Strongyloides ratti]CEF59845.1 Hypothetical protein SRAE_X000158900 [Strongyloides ratti]
MTKKTAENLDQIVENNITNTICEQGMDDSSMKSKPSSCEEEIDNSSMNDKSTSCDKEIDNSLINDKSTTCKDDLNDSPLNNKPTSCEKEIDDSSMNSKSTTCKDDLNDSPLNNKPTSCEEGIDDSSINSKSTSCEHDLNDSSIKSKTTFCEKEIDDSSMNTESISCEQELNVSLLNDKSTSCEEGIDDSLINSKSTTCEHYLNDSSIKSKTTSCEKEIDDSSMNTESISCEQELNVSLLNDKSTFCEERIDDSSINSKSTSCEHDLNDSSIKSKTTSCEKEIDDSSMNTESISCEQELDVSLLNDKSTSCEEKIDDSLINSKSTTCEHDLNDSSIKSKTTSCEQELDDSSMKCNDEFLEQNVLITEDKKIDDKLTIISPNSNGLETKENPINEEVTENDLDMRSINTISLSYHHLKKKRISLFSFYNSLLTNILTMEFKYDTIVDDFVLSSETLVTIYNELKKMENKERFIVAERMIYLSIKYILPRNNDEFDKSKFYLNNEEIIIDIIKTQMNFSLRKTFFSFVYLITSDISLNAINKTDDLILSNLLAENIYLRYFASSPEQLLEEEISIIDDFEFRMFILTLHERICGEFSNTTLPLKKDTVSGFLSFFGSTMGVLSVCIFMNITNVRRDKENIQTEIKYISSVLENLIPQFLYLIESESFENIISKTNLIESVEEMSQMLSILFVDKRELLSSEIFNNGLINIYFAVAFIILKLGYHAIKWKPYYEKFFQFVNVWKNVMNYIVDIEASKTRSVLKNMFHISSSILKSYESNFNTLFDVYRRKMRKERKLVFRT